jgi:hypothetical protein
LRVVVDQHGERKVLVAYEGGGVAVVAGPDGDNLGAEAGDLSVVLAQLRGMFAAVNSTEVPEEHQHDRLVAPEITEPVRHTGVIDELDVGECREIHDRSVYDAVIVAQEELATG